MLFKTIFSPLKVFFLATLFCSCSSQDQNTSLKALHDSSSVSCDSSFWSHVYTPSRFKVLQNCIELTGIVWETPSIEGDGDYHILVRLDPGQENYLNHKNNTLKDSCLVVETVCAVRDHNSEGETRTTLFYDLLYSDLPQCCENYVNTVYTPKKGEHIRVRGPLVMDVGKYEIVKHGWLEIHPANKIEIIK